MLFDMESIWNKNKLAEARKAQNMKRDEAAAALAITPEYLSMLENGKKSPSQKLIAQMCDLYHQKPSYFLSDSVKKV